MRQDIYNESDNLSSKIISMRYYVKPDASSRWAHRDIEYNAAGTPILRLYVGETKQVFKDIYVNGVKSNLQFNGKLNLAPIDGIINDERICEITGNSHERWITVRAINVGTYAVEPNVTGIVDTTLSSNVNDANLLIVVENEPTIVGLEWGHENPLVLNSLSLIDLSIKCIYSNNQRYEISSDLLNQLIVLSSNPHAVKITDYKICPNNLDERCQIKISDASLIETFQDTIKNIEPLTIITSENIDSKSLLEANFKVEYEKELPLLDMDDNYMINIYGIYELTSGEILKYLIHDIYDFKSTNVSIIDITDNVTTSYGLGNAQIIGTCPDVDETFTVIPKDIIWDVHVVKSISSIEWNIDKTELNIGVDTGILTVIATYTDGSSEDISNVCTYKYDDKYIKIDGNTVTPIVQGYTTISVLAYDKYGKLVSDNEITIRVIQPITKMTLNEHVLELLIGDKRTLKFDYLPEDATPMNIEWSSTEPDIVSVDSDGNLEVLNRGSADIIVTTIPKNKINDDRDIYLPENLEIQSITNSDGIAEIKLLDSILYSVKLFDVNNTAIPNTHIKYSSKTEQQLFITYISNELINYDRPIYAEVRNFYNDKVYTMRITTYIQNHNHEVIDTIISKTNKNGIATIQSLNKAYTNNDGVVIIDGIKIEIKYIDTYLSNVEVEHKDNNEIIILISNELKLEPMQKLYVKITDFSYEDDEDFEKGISTKVKIYNNDILLYDNYTAKNGEIIIDAIDDENILDESNESLDDENIITNLMEYNPTQCAICKVIANAINVTDVRFKQSGYLLDVTDNPIPLEVEVLPEEASFKDCSFIIQNTQVAKLTEDDELYGYKAGTTKIIAISNDNPNIKAEADVEITNYTIESVVINKGNDKDYEWYDHLNKKISVANKDGYITSGLRVTGEKYDDDDFARYYVPVNNSLKINASVYPSTNVNSNLKWMSSDSNLVKVNENGIVTAVRYGTQELDVYGDDALSETRFANTVWITAMNPQYKKYAVCQVRVTRNKTLAIEIPNTEEHDCDIDDIENGHYNSDSEHEFDYVMHVGDTIKMPINLITQDSNFGTSDKIKWFGSANLNDIITISNGSPNHDNVYDDNFNWSGTNPEIVNNNKNEYEAEITAIGIGDVSIYAMSYDNVRPTSSKQIYVPLDAEVIEIPKNGIAHLKSSSKYGVESIRVDWISKTSTILQDYRQEIIDSLKNVDISTDFNFHGTKIVRDGQIIIDEVLNTQYIATHGLPVVGAKCILNPNGVLKIVIPESCKVTNLKTTAGSDSLPVIIKFVPKIDKFANMIESNNMQILDTNSANEYIQVTLYANSGSSKIHSIYLDGIYENNNNKISRKNYATGSLIMSNDNKKLLGYFPATTKVEELESDLGDPFNARPGAGVWTNGPKSRRVKIRVVATPKKLKLGWINAWNTDIESINTIKTNSVTMNKWSDDKYKYLAISYDDEFKELLEEANERNAELAEKYKSFAWFSDNEEVIRFEDVENLDYKTKQDNNTNNPNESYQEIKADPISISFKNIDVSKYDGYVNVGTIADVKFGENYTYAGDDLAVNDTNMCIIRLTAPHDGEFAIYHSGTLQYANDETFTNSKVITAKSGYVDNKISAKRGDVIYVKGNTGTVVYIRSLDYYQDDMSFGWGIEAKNINKSPSEYNLYQDMFLLKLPGDDSRSYSSIDGVILYDDTTAIKFTPTNDMSMTINLTSGSIKIGNKTINASVKPYTFDVSKDEEYTIIGNSSSGATISSIEYINKLGEGHTGSFKNTNLFTVKPSYMKRVICEGRGKANIYVLSPKGDVLISKTINIK